MSTPTVTNISPSSGTTSGGTSVTITGTDFTGVTEVTFGGTPVTSFSFVDDTQIDCITPSRSGGAANVVVTNADGPSTDTVPYTYVPPPTVSSISPNSGTANGGTSVTITGTNFTGATGVTISGAAVPSFSVINTTRIDCITCPTTTPGVAGAASVQVTTPGGTSAANTLYSYVLMPPTVTSISPTSGTSGGGTTVTLTGTNFSAITSVTFRGAAATSVTVHSSTSLTCTTPAVSMGAASVLVTTPSGANVANTLFNYVPPVPTLDSVSPNTGSTLGGTLLTLNGSDLATAAGVTIGGVPATNLVVNSDTSVSCIAPSGSVGPIDVLVTTAGGTNANNTLYTYALIAPTVSSISPAQGTTEGGTTVTVTGASFTGTTGVTIGGAAATRVVVLNDTTLTCATPVGSAGAVRSVVVTTPNGSNAANGYFTYVVALPTVSSVSPPIGASAGGSSVTLTGTHFTGATSVTFGGMPVTGMTVVNDTTLTCTTPAGLAGTTSVLVTAAAGTSAANTLYLYLQATPTDTYIYLKGGRGDGFVPLWTGAISEEGMVSDTGTTLGTAGKEVSDPYRDTFPSSTISQSTNVQYAGFAAWVIPGPGAGANFYPDDGSPTTNTGKGRLSDEVAHLKPRQYARVSTWLIFTAQSGLPYKFRKDLVLGWGSNPRS